MSVFATVRIISPKIIGAGLLCLALAGCGKKTFDQSYDDKQKQLAREQAAMQKELDQRMTEKPGLESEASAPAGVPAK